MSETLSIANVANVINKKSSTKSCSGEGEPAPVGPGVAPGLAPGVDQEEDPIRAPIPQRQVRDLTNFFCKFVNLELKTFFWFSIIFFKFSILNL